MNNDYKPLKTSLEQDYLRHEVEVFRSHLIQNAWSIKFQRREDRKLNNQYLELGLFKSAKQFEILIDRVEKEWSSI